MKTLPALLDTLLAGLSARRLSQPYVEYNTLAPVWVVPMVRHAEIPPTHADALRMLRGIGNEHR